MLLQHCCNISHIETALQQQPYGSQIWQVDCRFFTIFLTVKTLWPPLYGWDSTVSRLAPLRGGSLLFIIKIPEIPGTSFVDFNCLLLSKIILVRILMTRL